MADRAHPDPEQQAIDAMREQFPGMSEAQIRAALAGLSDDRSGRQLGAQSPLAAPPPSPEGQAVHTLLETFPGLSEGQVRGALKGLGSSQPEPVVPPPLPPAARPAAGQPAPEPRPAGKQPAPAPEARPAGKQPRPAEKAPAVIAVPSAPVSAGAGPVAAALVVAFFRRLQVMVSAGTPVHSALDFLSEEPNPRLRLAIRDVHYRISSGTQLSRALQAHPRVFPPLAVQMVQAGETTGQLHVTLGSLADYLEKSLNLRRRFVSALAYPGMMAVVGLAVVAMLALIVFPKEREVFEGMGAELPWITRAVTGTFELIFNPVTVISVLVVVTTLAVTWPTLGRAFYNAHLRYPVDALLLRIPLLGRLIEQAAIVRMLTAMATFMETGIPMTGMQAVGRLSGNQVIERQFNAYLQLMRNGYTIAQAMEQADLFPSMVLQMFRLGEEHGRLDFLMRKTAQMLEEDLDYSLETLTALLEPLLMAVMGIVVGIIVIASSLPTMELLQKL